MRVASFGESYLYCLRILCVLIFLYLTLSRLLICNIFSPTAVRWVSARGLGRFYRVLEVVSVHHMCKLLARLKGSEGFQKPLNGRVWRVLEGSGRLRT